MAERRLIAVEGVVQGVGFRPYVHRLAAVHAVRGSVRNGPGGVLIDVEGDPPRVDEFCRALEGARPVLAAISRLRVESAPPRAYDAFVIAPSDESPCPSPAHIPADVATCDACLAELFDPGDRRFEHPFITCTECGPRFTILRESPYDRARTTMSAFPLCESCRREYADPSDRRFHAEAIACPDCGPMLAASPLTSGAARVTERAALAMAVDTLRGGGIVAIKALGGFHLASDATNDTAVQRLRARKRRPAKPFAVMVRDSRVAAMLGELSDGERQALESAARPVVLLRRTPGARVAGSVAPGAGTLGLMLPSTPLHHLLLAALDRPLVMTSGNRSGDPVVLVDADAHEQLGNIADLLLTHDRAIASRCDDSVVRWIAGGSRSVRRARGHVPGAIRLPFPVRTPILAVGGHLKNTVCVAHGTRAHLSAHVGDLETVHARVAMREAIEGTIRDAGTRPRVVAHDLHPGYASTQVADGVATEEGITQRVAVQHHHAHVAACLAEHAVHEPVIGVAFDGTGLGTDGAIWGGEFLLVDGARFTRCGHLAYVPLPGGDAATRRPWRSAMAHLSRVDESVQRAAGRPPGIADDEWTLARRLVHRPEHSPPTSSVGRLFDAVASLLDLCHVASFEGQGATALEAAASGRATSRYAIALTDAERWTADPGRMVEGVVSDRAAGHDASDIAAAFHGALSDLVVNGCERVRETSGLSTVVLSGGVFINKLLTEQAHDALARRGFRVLLARAVPCNDGGLALGQAYVAACALEEEPCA